MPARSDTAMNRVKLASGAIDPPVLGSESFSYRGAGYHDVSGVSKNLHGIFASNMTVAWCAGGGCPGLRACRGHDHRVMAAGTVSWPALCRRSTPLPRSAPPVVD